MYLRTVFFDARPVLLLALIAVAAFAPASALEVNPASKDVAITIGDSLILSWDGLDPEALYHAVVTDEEGWMVAEAWLRPGSDGVLGPAPVWIGTGVVGCDKGADPNPDGYRFSRMEEAEDFLKDRTFDLTLLDDGAQRVARIPLQLVVAEQNVFYFSDQDGCPRCQYSSDESVYLSGSRVVMDAFWMFLFEVGDRALEVGDPLNDVREEPQEIQPPSSYFTEQVAGGLVRGPVYQGALEPANNSSAVPNTHTPVGVIVGPGLCKKGIPSIQVEACGKDGIELENPDEECP